MSLKDTDFMSELDEVANLKPSFGTVFLMFSIVALIIGFFFWSAYARVEEITRGQGQVVPSQEIQVVQSLEGGVLQELLVRDGQVVEKGQVLARIRDVQYASEERGTEVKVFGLELRRNRLVAEAKSIEFVVENDLAEKAPSVVQNEKALYDSRQRELQNAYDILDDKIEKAEADLAEVNAQINRLSQSRKLLREELSITREMVKRRAVPKLEEIRLNRELSDISGQINAESQRRASLQAQLKTAKNERAGQEDKFRSDSLDELSKVETELRSLQENLKAVGDRVDRTELRAPVKGVVNAVNLTTIGGVVEPAMRLIEIVPSDDELKIMAQVKPEEVAFIRPGNKAKVKITAYDPQKYGALDGELVRIGASSVTDRDNNVFFEIEVRTNKIFMGDASSPLPITPGMVADVEIITGKRSILEYLMKPLLRARDRAFTER